MHSCIHAFLHSFIHSLTIPTARSAAVGIYSGRRLWEAEHVRRKDRQCGTFSITVRGPCVGYNGSRPPGTLGVHGAV